MPGRLMTESLLGNSSSEEVRRSGSGNGLLLLKDFRAEFFVEPLVEFFAEFRVLIFLFVIKFIPVCKVQ